MIGNRIGIKVGARVGLAVGVSEDPISGGDSGNPLSGVSRDATSGIYCPANASEWSTVMAAAGIGSGGPSLLWLCQEASGNLADSIGSFTGTMSGAPFSYQQSVAGWTRKFITGGDAGTGQATTTSASLPDPAAGGAYLLLSYTTITGTPAALRSLAIIGTAVFTFPQLTTTPRFGGASGANTTNGAVTPVGPVRPVVTLYDPGAANRVNVYNDLESLAVTRGATTGKTDRLQFTFPGGHGYKASFYNAAAQLTDNQVRTLLQTLGWPIAW